MLVIYCSFWFPIFLGDDDHSATQIGAGVMIPFLTFSQIGLSYLIFVVVWNWNKVMFSFAGLNLPRFECGLESQTPQEIFCNCHIPLWQISLTAIV